MKLRKRCIYRFNSENGDTPLCIYIGKSQNKKKHIIVPLVPDNIDNSVALDVVNQYALPFNKRSVDKFDIISPLFVNGGYATVSNEVFKEVCLKIISYKLDLISSHTNNLNESFDDYNKILDFLDWKLQKMKFNTSGSLRNFKAFQNGVYWVNLGYNVGSELNKMRPALIWKKRESNIVASDNSYIVIPITSKKKSKKYISNVEIQLKDRLCYLKLEDMKRVHIDRISMPMLDNDKNIIFIDSDKRIEICQAMQHFYLEDNTYQK